jgi:hypothetical protein
MIEAKVPVQVRSIARLELKELAAMMQNQLGAAKGDRDLRAHLDYNLSRIEKVLNAGYHLPLK